MGAKPLDASTLPYIPCSVEYTVDNNPYKNLYVDLTMRCDMDCNYCYNPLRSRSDLSVEHFEEVCRRLPLPVDFKLLGGEPTMHPRFFDFIRIARQYDHSVFFASNGLRYTNPSFMRKLQAVDVNFVAGLSMDGGTTNDGFYEVMNNRRCLDKKMQAMHNLHEYAIKRVALSAIVVRDYNEQVIGELIGLADRYPDCVRYIHFRSAAKTGRWAETEPYSQHELREAMAPHIDPQKLVQEGILQEIHCTPEEGGECCFRFRPNRRLQISLIEFASEKSQRCPKRGKLLPGSFRIQPFYENMVRVGDVLADDFGEMPVALS